jgi:membrane-associated phospholipid phosphatase
MRGKLNARRIWMISAPFCAAAVTLSFIWFDMPIARLGSQNLGRLDAIGIVFGSAVILSLEAVAAIALVTARLARRHLSPLSKALALACFTSMCAYAVNDGVLKYFFGVPSPQNTLLLGARHAFHLFAGTEDSGFPSGHMVLASAFAGVFMRLYPSSIWPLSALLILGGSLMIFGDWHFASDVIAGAFAGVSAGVLAGALWQVHSIKYTT